MPKSTLFQVVGVALLVIGGQGAIRLLAHRSDAGLAAFLPGGFPVWLGAHLILACIGVVLATWGRYRGREG